MEVILAIQSSNAKSLVSGTPLNVLGRQSATIDHRGSKGTGGGLEKKITSFGAALDRIVHGTLLEIREGFH